MKWLNWVTFLVSYLEDFVYGLYVLILLQQLFLHESKGFIRALSCETLLHNEFEMLIYLVTGIFCYTPT